MLQKDVSKIEKVTINPKANSFCSQREGKLESDSLSFYKFCYLKKVVLTLKAESDPNIENQNLLVRSLKTRVQLS